MLHLSVLDRARFPGLSAYLDALPAGLASYPECQSKGALVRSALDEVDLSAHLGALPEPVAAVVDARPALTEWVSAVVTDAVFHAVCDLRFPTEEAVMTWTYERTRRVAKSQAYRHFLAVAGPGFFLRVATRTHSFFQRGTEMAVELLEPNRSIVAMHHPPHLHSRLNQLTNVALLRAVVDMTGGLRTRSEMIEHGPTGARYECRWE